MSRFTELLGQYRSSVYESDKTTEDNQQPYGFDPRQKTSWQGRLVSLIDLSSQIINLVKGVALTTIGVVMLAGAPIMFFTVTPVLLISGVILKSETLKIMAFAAFLIWLPLLENGIKTSVCATRIAIADIAGLVVPEVGRKARQSKLNPYFKALNACKKLKAI